MKLQHPAVFDIEDILKIVDVNNVKQLVKNIAVYGNKQDPDLYKPLTYMGDCWELFSEYFFKYFNGDHTLTYTVDYEPNLEYDRGIDARGISTLDGKPNFIQDKFKLDPTAYLNNSDNISNILADAVINENLQYNGKNIIVFTSCQGVHPKHAMSNVHCIGIKQISRRVDKNIDFWDTFKKVIEETTVNLNE
tara:strand:- start:570 stop:1145 length:576 start_codon:yes stop_codon:yes gene_type:complete